MAQGSNAVAAKHPILKAVSLGALALASVGLFAASESGGSSVVAATPVPTQAEAIQAVPVTWQWTTQAAEQPAGEIAASADEGLRPQDYGLARLHRAMAAGAGAELDQAANASALALARDYAQGRVGNREQFDWFIERSPYETADIPARLSDAVARGEVRRYLRSLLPQDARYAALRDTYVRTSPADTATRDRLRVNMERWRWMPRTLGDRYIYVNVPSYRLRLMDKGVTLTGYDVVVGSPKTPTPQLTAPASSVVVNPWWYVPQSIVKSSNLRPGRAGYVFTASGSGYSVKQAPGPKNSLGQIKIDMPNAHAIYLHDTPAKALFARDQRAFSHGCIRVKDIDQLAADLLQYDQASAERLDSALGTTDTTTIRMAKQWPVYLVYFTADIGEDGQLTSYGDPYGRDAKVLAALDGAAIRPMTIASR